MGQPSKLTPELQARVVGYIRAGAYDWVAAQAVGVSPKTFQNWMKWGSTGNDSYVAFFREVSQARSQARVIAENATFKDNPFAWLRYGPGRERPGEPGWTESKELTGANAGPVNVKVEDAREQLATRLAALAERQGSAGADSDDANTGGGGAA